MIECGIRRAFSLLDQNPHSPTFGCFDRTFWKYKMVSDRPAISYQQLILVLALRYKHAHLFSERLNLIDLIKASIRFWATYQHPDGSFDEWFENERSFCVTAFTTYAVSEALYILNSADNDTSFMTTALHYVQKSAKWLSQHDSSFVTNQMAMSMLALHNTALLTKDPFFDHAYLTRKNALLSKQNSEGWFPEYGGPDIGYLSLTLDALSKDYEKKPDPDVLESLKKGFSFLKYFFNPDGSIGGELGRRNTQYIFPHGLEIMKSQLSDAADCLSRLTASLEKNGSPHPLTVDDRYFAYFFMPNYMQAHIHHATQRFSVKQSEESHGTTTKTTFFPHAKLFIITTPTYTAYTEGNKCGILKIYHKNKMTYAQCGYLIQTQSGRFTNQVPLVDECEYVPELRRLKIKGHFTRVNEMSPMRRFPFLFRLFQKTVLKSSRLNTFFNIYIKNKLILKPHPEKITFESIYHFKDEYVETKESFYNHTNHPILNMAILDSAILPFSPTSQFSSDGSARKQCNLPIHKGPTLILHRKISFLGQNLTFTFESM